eukprot:scaffold11278_cov145-Isochrysis_galbana.AAC.6
MATVQEGQYSRSDRTIQEQYTHTARSSSKQLAASRGKQRAESRDRDQRQRGREGICVCGMCASAKMRMRTHKHSARERPTVQSTRAHGCHDHDHTHLAPCLAPHSDSPAHYTTNEDRPRGCWCWCPQCPHCTPHACCAFIPIPAQRHWGKGSRFSRLVPGLPLARPKKYPNLDHRPNYGIVPPHIATAPLPLPLKKWCLPWADLQLNP